LAAVTIALFVVSLGLLSYLIYWQTKSIILHNVEKELTLLAQNDSKKIENFFEKNTGNLQLIASSPNSRRKPLNKLNY